MEVNGTLEPDDLKAQIWSIQSNYLSFWDIYFS